MAETEHSFCTYYRRRKTITATELPPDVLMCNILPRLPVKSVGRCMSVSKQWYSFLKNRKFSNMHLHHVTNDDHQNNQKLIVLLSMASPTTFRIIDCEAPPDDGLTPSQALPSSTRCENMSIIASCNGLVCVGLQKNKYNIREGEYTDLMLWNPLTCESKTLSKDNSHKDCYEISQRPFGLYYTFFDDDYKLLHVAQHYNIYIYSLKNDSWRKVIYSTKDIQHIAYCWRSPYCWRPISTWLSGSLYFLKQTMREGAYLRTYSIIRFDSKTEKFTAIATPTFENQTSVCFSFTAEKGYLQLCMMLNIREADTREWCIELFRKNGDKDWTKVLSYCWIPCLEIGPIKPCLINNIRRIHLMRNGNLLIRYTFRDGLYQLDPEKHTKHNKLTSYISKSMEIDSMSKYIQTFVSPNQYMK